MLSPPAVSKWMDTEGEEISEVGKREKTTQVEYPAFLLKSRVVFVLARRRSSECPTTVKAPLLAGNPFCLTHSHPDANAKECL